MDAMNRREEELLREARERFDNATEHEKDNRDLAAEDLCFLAGEQWPETIKIERERDARPCLTINRLPQFLRQVTGEARQNKPAIKVMPKDDNADPDTAAVYEGLIRQIEVQSKADQAYITGLEHAAGGGFGAWRVTTEYADQDSFDQDIRVKRIPNPFAVYWDPNATEYDRSDAMWCFVTEWISKEDFERRWPKETPKDWELEYGRNDCHAWLRDQDDFVRIAEYWVKKPVTRVLGMTQDGRTLDITDMPHMRPMMARIREADTYKVVRYVLAGHAVLEEEQEWPGRYIPIIPVLGPEEWYEGKARYLSVIRYAKDPQRQYNYWQSAITEKIALAPLAPYVGTQEMFEGHEEVWSKANKEAFAYLPHNPDPQMPGRGPERNQPASMHPAELAQSAQAIDDLKATTGIYDASLGGQGNETSGRAIIARQSQADTSTFAWIDNLGRSIEHTGRVLLDLIPRIYDTERQVRILGEDGRQETARVNAWVRDEMGNPVLMHDLSVGKYDVEIKVGPSFKTRREEAAASITEFVRAFPAAGPVLIPLIAKHMDWPEADTVSDALKKMAPPGTFEDEEPREPSPAEQMQMQQAQLQMAELQAKVAKLEADTQYTQARAQSEGAQMMNRAVEAEGAQIENAQKMLELALSTPAFQNAVQAEVQAILQRVSGNSV